MKNKIYELLRKYVARMATGKLGKVEILDDEIICYVDGKKLKKKEKYLHRYNLIFKMVNPTKEIYKIYNLQKPVHYIMEDINFDMEVNIRASMQDCHVTFKNCTFTAAIEIDFADHLTFINNTYIAQNYKNYLSIYKEGEFCISTKANKNEVNKIELLMENITVEDTPIIPIVRATDISKKTFTKQTKKSTIQIWLYAKNITMIYTDIIGAKSIDIGTDKLILTKTNINADEIEVNTNNIESNYFNNEVISNIILVYVNNFKGELCAKYNTLFVNGVEVNKNEKNIDNQSLKLQQQRLELINSLKKIERTCEETIAEEIKKQPLTRVLKK